MPSPGVIRAPAVRPPTFSLVQTAIAANQVTDEDQRWELGYEFQPDSCGDAVVRDPCDPSSYSPSARPASVVGEPFVVEAGDVCSSFGWRAADYEARARRLLERCESKQIAKEFWEGNQATASGWPNQKLADVSSDVLTTGPTAVVDVLACLEQGLATGGCGTRGMIHATVQLVTHWFALGNTVLRREGGLLLTAHDNIVVTDGGYSGMGPNGQVAGDSQWAYATGLVTVVRSPVEITPGTLAEAMDRSDNTVEYRAWRLAAVMWDGCSHYAAEADLEACAFGGAS